MHGLIQSMVSPLPLHRRGYVNDIIIIIVYIFIFHLYF